MGLQGPQTVEGLVAKNGPKPRGFSIQDDHFGFIFEAENSHHCYLQLPARVLLLITVTKLHDKRHHATENVV